MRGRKRSEREIAAPFVTNPNGRWFLPGAGKTEWFKDIEAGPEMVIVPSGTFMMGSPEDEPERNNNEGPQHEVTIPKPFAIGRCAVTRGQFAAFVAGTGHKTDWRGGYITGGGGVWKSDPSKSWRDPGFAQDDSHPVVRVNWDDAQAYVTWLSQASGAPYRLPSEAEWEWVCRAGSGTPFWWGSGITQGQANYGGTYSYGRDRTVPARHFEPNPGGSIRFMAMSGSGAAIAGTTAIRARLPTARHGQPVIAAAVSFAAARGTTIILRYSAPSAARGTALTHVTTTMASVLPGRLHLESLPRFLLQAAHLRQTQAKTVPPEAATSGWCAPFALHFVPRSLNLDH